ncbi:MAG TPA: hypothetical protein VFK06_24725 [Candidatus Angelobacter sp.]|nr:hypothetical protein [Candidatus Angelobacter sp.]
MSLLRVDTPGKPNKISVDLDGNTHKRLRAYSRFSGNGTINSIVKSALNYAFDQDTKFVEWEKDPENQVEPEIRKRRKRGESASPEGGASSAAAAAAKK